LLSGSGNPIKPTIGKDGKYFRKRLDARMSNGNAQIPLAHSENSLSGYAVMGVNRID
jgi:hypothetical protein